MSEMSTTPERDEESRLTPDAQITEDAQLAAAIAASMEDAGLSTADAAAAAAGLLEEEEPAPPPPHHIDPEVDASRQMLDADRDLSRQMSAANPELNRDRTLRAQQDSEFEASLAFDRAKAESRALEEHRKNQRAATREAKRARVPAEPDAGEGVAELVIRFPDGARVRRRFRESDTLEGVADFVEATADLDAGYDFVTPFPRKVLADRKVSLAEAGLVPKAVLVVHLR